ncbi:RWD domain-containing protein 2B [Chlorella vulgaris]
MHAGPADVESQLSALRAQLEEIEALRACYPEELILTPAEEDILRFAAHLAESAAATAEAPALSGTLRLNDHADLNFVLPKRGGSEARLQVIYDGHRQDADALQHLASNIAAECARDGVPCLLLAANQLLDAARELAEAEAEAEAAVRQQAGQQPPAARCRGQRAQQREARQLVLSRRCVWFHHIKNLAKRKHIVEWGHELGLGGYSKPGFPGVVLIEVRLSAGAPLLAAATLIPAFWCCHASLCTPAYVSVTHLVAWRLRTAQIVHTMLQGAGSDVDEYLSRLRALRWQAMAVRGQQDEVVSSLQELEAGRRLPLGVHELGEEDMGRLASACRESGLEPLFLTALKLGGGTV